MESCLVEGSTACTMVGVQPCCAVEMSFFQNFTSHSFTFLRKAHRWSCGEKCLPLWFLLKLQLSPDVVYTCTGLQCFSIGTVSTSPKDQEPFYPKYYEISMAHTAAALLAQTDQTDSIQHFWASLKTPWLYYQIMTELSSQLRPLRT